MKPSPLAFLTDALTDGVRLDQLSARERSHHSSSPGVSADPSGDSTTPLGTSEREIAASSENRAVPGGRALCVDTESQAKFAGILDVDVPGRDQRQHVN